MQMWFFQAIFVSFQQCRVGVGHALLNMMLLVHETCSGLFSYFSPTQEFLIFLHSNNIFLIIWQKN